MGAKTHYYSVSEDEGDFKERLKRLGWNESCYCKVAISIFMLQFLGKFA
jgi:hypothetical protein